MKKVYADNGSTSFPKAPGVALAMKEFIDEVGCNINRGGYQSSYDVSFMVLETRKLLCELFHWDDPRSIIFTPGATYSLNMLIKGFLKPGDHVITTSMEHNAVMRSLNQQAQIGVELDRVPCASDGSLNPADIIPLIKPNTKGVIMIHGSNVCGTVMPIYEVSEICKERGLRLIVDAAQTAGILDIDAGCVDALAFTGHKGLMAAQGLGGFFIKPDFVPLVDSIITGGTGSASHQEVQPDFMPDKFECGTVNIPGILGLRAALLYRKEYGGEKILAEELRLAETFLNKVRELPGVEIIGKQGIEGRLAAVSLNFNKMDNAEVSAALAEDYGIMTRCGLHCAPSAHKTLGTYPGGTVRFSFGHFNTREEVHYIADSVKELLKTGERLGF